MEYRCFTTPLPISFILRLSFLLTLPTPLSSFRLLLHLWLSHRQPFSLTRNLCPLPCHQLLQWQQLRLTFQNINKLMKHVTINCPWGHWMTRLMLVFGLLAITIIWVTQWQISILSPMRTNCHNWLSLLRYGWVSVRWVLVL